MKINNSLLADNIVTALLYPPETKASAAALVERVLDQCPQPPALPKPSQAELAALDWVQKNGANHGVELTRLLQRAGIIRKLTPEERLSEINCVIEKAGAFGAMTPALTDILRILTL